MPLRIPYRKRLKDDIHTGLKQAHMCKFQMQVVLRPLAETLTSDFSIH